jgi:hypothetical protein
MHSPGFEHGVLVWKFFHTLDGASAEYTHERAPDQQK